MYYLNVYMETPEKAHLVVVEKEYFSGRRKYHVAHVEILEDSVSGLTSALFEMRLAPEWITTKTVFSQSGRPPRIKEEPPLILLSSEDDGLHMAEALRARCASVEVLVRREPGDLFRKKLKAQAFDNCHVVNPGMLYKSLSSAVRKGRLGQDAFYGASRAVLKPIGEALARSPELMPSFNGATPWFYALAGAVWHGETIRRIKRY